MEEGEEWDFVTNSELGERDVGVLGTEQQWYWRKVEGLELYLVVIWTRTC